MRLLGVRVEMIELSTGHVMWFWDWKFDEPTGTGNNNFIIEKISKSNLLELSPKNDQVRLRKDLTKLELGSTSTKFKL